MGWLALLSVDAFEQPSPGWSSVSWGVAGCRVRVVVSYVFSTMKTVCWAAWPLEGAGRKKMPLCSLA